MRLKIKSLCDRFSALLGGWEGVECVAVNEDAEGDSLDPYFALNLDVFYRSTIPSASERAALYGGDVTALESRPEKDRFLVDDVPAHLEFKATAHVDELVAIAQGATREFHLIKNSGTYGFYRLMTGKIIYSRDRRAVPRPAGKNEAPARDAAQDASGIGWIVGVRRRLECLPDAFWTAARAASQSKMEHYLSDLGAAVQESDDFNYLVSAAGFIKSACQTLFNVNHRFEPSHRAYSRQIAALPYMSDNFPAEAETFLREDGGMGRDLRYAHARAIAKNIVSM